MRDIITKYVKKQLSKTKHGKYNIKALSRHRLIRENWDQRKSVSENMRHITSEVVQNYLPEQYSPPEPPKLRPADLETCLRLKERYGTDYRKMARDLALNRWQWTAKECERRIAKLPAASPPDF